MGLNGSRTSPNSWNVDCDTGEDKEVIQRKINHRKSRCCKAKIEYSGGGYDGEYIEPVRSFCKNCGRVNPSVIQKVGRPQKLLF